MDNIILVRLEIIVFLMSLSYIFYYLLDKIKDSYFKIRRIIEPERPAKRIRKIKLSPSKKIAPKMRVEKEVKRAEKEKELTPEEKDKLVELIKRSRVNSSKWYFDTAKNLIIEWLAIDKYNRDLNFELAHIYESEKNYRNAEYIYRDLIDNLWDKFILLEKMASVLLMQWFVKKAIKFYKKALSKKPNDLETIEVLSELTFETKDYEACKEYTILYLKDNPRDPHKLTIRWYCTEKLWDKKWAVEQYRKVLDMQPYNTEIKQRIEKLEKKLEKDLEKQETETKQKEEETKETIQENTETTEKKEENKEI